MVVKQTNALSLQTHFYPTTVVVGLFFFPTFRLYYNNLYVKMISRTRLVL